MVSQQIKQLQNQVQTLQNQAAELEVTKQALDDISKTKEGTEILVPVSAGIFLKGALKDNKELSINVGSGTVVTKTIPEARKILDEQVDEIKKIQEKASAEFLRLNQQAMLIQKHLEELSK